MNEKIEAVAPPVAAAETITVVGSAGMKAGISRMEDEDVPVYMHSMAAEELCAKFKATEGENAMLISKSKWR